MKVTIEAKVGYKVKRLHEKFYGEFVYEHDNPYFISSQTRIILDGKEVVMLADIVDKSDYEYEKEYNEMFYLCEIFRTVSGNIFAYWRDEELGKDYITKLGD